MSSIWIEKAGNSPEYTRLIGEKEVDVAIIGAGITGLTAAFRLLQTGKRVAVIEALDVGYGTTGHSSCHLTTEIESKYSSVEKQFGLDTAALVADARIEGINFIETISKIYNIDCDFRRVPGFWFTEEESKAEEIRKEADKAAKSGISVDLMDDMPLKVNAKAIARFNDQGEFNSQKYLNGLAAVILKKGGQIYTQSRVSDIEESTKGFTVVTDDGVVKSKAVIQATHLPLFINVLQTLAAPYRSYLVAFRLKEHIPHGLYWDDREPYNYLRIIEDEYGQILLAGGADHKTGHEIETEKSYDYIEQFVRDRFNVGEVLNKWSSQYYVSADGLPYIGENPFGGNSLVATGFGGDGLVYGTVAGIILSDKLTGVENKWEQVFKAKRFTPLASAKEFIKENTDVAVHLIKDRLKSFDSEISEIAPGEGKIISYNGEKLAVARDKYNELHFVSPVCTHMKCYVQWNREGESWDCPCHGSRFNVDGEIIIGPAVKALEKKRVPSSEYMPKNNKPNR